MIPALAVIAPARAQSAMLARPHTKRSPTAHRASPCAERIDTNMVFPRRSRTQDPIPHSCLAPRLPTLIDDPSFRRPARSLDRHQDQDEITREIPFRPRAAGHLLFRLTLEDQLGIRVCLCARQSSERAR